jgi:hypothetical protein
MNILVNRNSYVTPSRYVAISWHKKGAIYSKWVVEYSFFCMRHKRPAFSCYRGARDVMTGVTARDAIFFPPVVAKRKEEGIRFNLCGEKRQLSHT